MWFGDILKKRENSSLNISLAIEKLNNTVKAIEASLDDHREAINESTNEIQSSFEIFNEMDQKIEKLNERIDRIQLAIGDKYVPKCPDYKIVPLTLREQEVFLVLYTNENAILTYIDIARRTGLTEMLVKGYILSIIRKGVPIVKNYINNKIYVTLDKHFRDEQVKKNVVQISPSVEARVHY